MLIRPEAQPDQELTPPPLPDPAVVDRKASKAASLIPVLLPYQQAWVSDSSPVKVCVKSRRIGISWAVACEAVFLASRKRDQKGMDVWYLSQSERDAKEFIRDCATWARVVDLWMSKKGSSAKTTATRPYKCRVLADDGKSSVQATRIKFTSGHRITILPGKNPDVLRGKQGYVIFDEAALLDIDACLRAAEALTMSLKEGRIAFISTQRGEGNGFNKKLVQAIKEKRKEVRGYKLHEYRLRDAIEQGYYQRWCAMRRRPYSKAREEQFFEACMAKVGAAQEFDCVPARDGEQYLPRDLLEKSQRAWAARDHGAPVIRCERPAGWEVRGTEEARVADIDSWCRISLKPALERLVSWEHHDLGWDFGRSAKGDLSVCAIMARRDDKERRKQIRSVPFTVELSGVPFKQQAQIFDFIASNVPHFGAGKIDATGNGSYLGEHARQKWGTKIEAIQFGAGARRWFETWMPQYKSALQAEELELPDYSDLTIDHEQFALDDSVPVLPKKRTKGEHGEQRHGDAALACVLAFAASKQPTTSMKNVGPVPTDRPRLTA